MPARSKLQLRPVGEQDRLWVPHGTLAGKHCASSTTPEPDLGFEGDAHFDLFGLDSTAQACMGPLYSLYLYKYNPKYLDSCCSSIRIILNQSFSILGQSAHVT